MSVDHELLVDPNELLLHFLAPHLAHAHRASRLHELRVDNVGELIELDVDYFVVLGIEHLRARAIKRKKSIYLLFYWLRLAVIEWIAELTSDLLFHALQKPLHRLLEFN